MTIAILEHVKYHEISWNVITSRQFPICFVQSLTPYRLRLLTPSHSWKVREMFFFFFRALNFQNLILGYITGWVVYYQPIWKICSSKWKCSSPIFGVKIKNIWVATTQLHNEHEGYIPENLTNGYPKWCFGKGGLLAIFGIYVWFLGCTDRNNANPFWKLLALLVAWDSHDEKHWDFLKTDRRVPDKLPSQREISFQSIIKLQGLR